MKKVGRRSFLQLLGAAPVAVQDMAGRISFNSGGPPHAELRHALLETCGTNLAPQAQVQASPLFTQAVQNRALRTVLANGDREIEALCYEAHRNVYHIDADIAGRRSWSIAAKISYQRQRNVQREIQDTVLEDTSWHRIQGWKARILLKVLGVKL